MGTWGPGIFEDDHALDTREEYLRLLLAGEEDAAQQLMAQPSDVDETPVFWLSLAATQQEYGRLDDAVRAEALRIIDDGEGMRSWVGEAQEKKRSQVLARLRQKLTGPQPRRRTPRPPRTVALDQGDVFRFRLEPGRYGFGRALIVSEHGWYAIYHHEASQPRPPLEEVVSADVAFCISNLIDDFRSKRWQVIGNRPLEAKLRQPIHFFHQPVGSNECEVFDIWAPEDSRIVHPSKCTAECWGAHSAESARSRLLEMLAGRPDPWPLRHGPVVYEAVEIHGHRILMPRNEVEGD